MHQGGSLVFVESFVHIVDHDQLNKDTYQFLAGTQCKIKRQEHLRDLSAACHSYASHE
jgi:hypothetical protein